MRSEPTEDLARVTTEETAIDEVAATWAAVVKAIENHQRALERARSSG